MLSIIMLINFFSVFTLFNMRQSSAIGVIGGADGPTAIYLAHRTGGGSFAVFIFILLLIIAGFVYMKARRKTR